MNKENNTISANLAKRVVVISKPDKNGVMEVAVYSKKYPNGLKLGQTNGTEGQWSLPKEMWNQEGLNKLMGDLEAGLEQYD